jgi:hypothetical protein
VTIAACTRGRARERVDVPHTYELDGGHFRITIDGEGGFRTLCCYCRSDADRLHKLIIRR